VIAHIVDPVSATPRSFGFVIEVKCPHCGRLHRHHWRRIDSSPGMKHPPCRPRGDGQYFVAPPQWSIEPNAAHQLDRVRQAIKGLDLGQISDVNERRAVAVAAANLADAVRHAKRRS
jgi:hypothetical protein